MLKKYKQLFDNYNFFIKKYSETDLHKFEEAVLSPIYYEEVENYLKKIKQKVNKQKFKSLRALCFYLSIKCRKYFIKFVIDDEKEKIGKYNRNEFKAGITKSSCLSNRKGTIKIYCNENLLEIQFSEKIYDYFIKNVIRIIGHELIHRNQIFHFENEKLRNFIFDHSKLDTIKYLKNKQEIMCRAWQIIEEFRYCGFNDKKILNLMKVKTDLMDKTKSDTLRMYYNYFNSKDIIFKDLYKYVYMYLDNQEVM